MQSPSKASKTRFAFGFGGRVWDGQCLGDVLSQQSDTALHDGNRFEERAVFRGLGLGVGDCAHISPLQTMHILAGKDCLRGGAAIVE